MDKLLNPLESDMFTVTTIEKNKNFKAQMLRMQRNIEEANKLEVACGFPANKAGLGTPYYEGAKGEKLSTIDVAIRNNFGFGVPERNFMDAATPRIDEQFKKISNETIQDIINGKVSAKKVLSVAGQMGQSAIQTAINSNLPPPNSPKTIEKKKSNKTLIDTGHMLQSVTYAVREVK